MIINNFYLNKKYPCRYCLYGYINNLKEESETIIFERTFMLFELSDEFRYRILLPPTRQG